MSELSSVEGYSGPPITKQHLPVDSTLSLHDWFGSCLPTHTPANVLQCSWCSIPEVVKYDLCME